MGTLSVDEALAEYIQVATENSRKKRASTQIADHSYVKRWKSTQYYSKNYAKDLKPKNKNVLSMVSEKTNHQSRETSIECSGPNAASRLTLPYIVEEIDEKLTKTFVKPKVAVSCFRQSDCKNSKTLPTFQNLPSVENSCKNNTFISDASIAKVITDSRPESSAKKHEVDNTNTLLFNITQELFKDDSLITETTSSPNQTVFKPTALDQNASLSVEQALADYVDLFTKSSKRRKSYKKNDFVPFVKEEVDSSPFFPKNALKEATKTISCPKCLFTTSDFTNMTLHMHIHAKFEEHSRIPLTSI